MAKKRFIKSVTDAARRDETPDLPWVRGPRRAIFVSRRAAAVEARKSA